MEKYFRVKSGSDLYNHWFEFDKNRDELMRIQNEFCDEVGIESNDFGTAKESVCIIPTEKDLQNFENQFTKKVYEDGIREFRKNSKTYKAWLKKLKSSNYERVIKPQIWHYFGAYGRTNTRIFDDGKNNVYCSINAECIEKKFEDVEEMKASDFFKVIEDIRENRKNACH